MSSKKAVFFSLDALIALSLIFVVVLVSYPLIKEKSHEEKIHYDVLAFLSSLTARETNNAEVQALIAQGIIASPDKKLIEVIGELYVTNKTRAKEMAGTLISELKTQENIGIWYGATLLASQNKTSYEAATKVQTARQIISGINGENGSGSVTGFSARAYLTNTVQSKYVYFGGYVGDGNLSIRLDYNGTIREAGLEITINNDFSIYINNQSAGSYTKSPSTMTPANYTLPAAYFQSGTNIIEIKGVNLSVSGGFIKVLYESSIQYEQPTRYYFPGIKGIVNLYDSFYVPGALSAMNMYIHYNSNYSLFLTVANTTVYNGSGGETIATLPNSQLSSLLNYSVLSTKTIPIRLGVENISLGSGLSNVDVVLITDVSGSMDWRLDSDVSGTARNCNDPALYSSSTKRISLAKCLDKDFVATILNASTDSRIALVSFSSSANSYTSLTRNQTLLNNTINAYVASGATCVSCAINKAYEILQAESSSIRKKYIIAMTDGVTNRRSTQTCTDIYGEASSDSSNFLAGGVTGILLKKNAVNIWDAVASPITTQINDIDMLTSTLGFAVGEGGIILQWNGVSWNRLSSPTTSALNSLDIYNSTFALAVGAGGSVIQWNGVSWSLLTTISQSPTLQSVTISSPSLIFASGTRSGTGRIYKSANSGSSWSLDYSAGSNFRSVKLVSPTLAHAVGNSGEIARWTGSSWSAMNSPTNYNLYSINAYNSTFALATGGTNVNAIAIRYNGAWSSSLNAIGGSLRDIEVLNNVSYTLGESATLFTYNNTAWTRKFEIPAAYQGNLTGGISCAADDDSCSVTNSFPALNANYSSCRARTDLNATVYSIGFGPVSTCGFANRTLQAVASCGNGTSYSSSNATELQQFYASIAQDIVRVSYTEQTAQTVGNITTKLYPDSYIEFNYTKQPFPYGLLITTEKLFTTNSSGSFVIPQNVTIVEARVASYSGSRWTTQVMLNNATIYNLSQYGQQYSRLGDPYIIQLPISLVQPDNQVMLTTGVSPTNISSGSLSDKIIFTVLKNASGYSPIAARAEGCIWTIDFDTGGNLTASIPANYTGTDRCSYQASGVSYDNNDALQEAVFRLLRALDLNSNHQVDITLTNEDITIAFNQLTGIPYTWSTEVQVRTWR